MTNQSDIAALSGAHAPETSKQRSATASELNTPASEPTALNLHNATFGDYGVSGAIVAALAEKGITRPFPIQALTLPIALKRADIIGQAKTGTGKTLGFGIPILEEVTGPGEEGWEELGECQGRPQGLVILPTRELAKQVAGDLRVAAAKRSVRVVDVYGGRAYEPQVEALSEGTEIVVGTPGRLIDLMKHHTLDLSHVSVVAIDEADEMLDLGFLDDVETILAATSPNRHTMLFSATMPGAVIAMARRYMSRPTHIRAQDPRDDSTTVHTTKQLIYRVHQMNKDEVIARILQADGRGLTIIFTKTKRQAATLTDELTYRGFAVGALHGDLGQGAREQALRAFRKGKIDVLVATDVAARGIDVDDVTHVINYQCPDDEKIYVHRIGRTGRAGHSGTAITFVDWEDTPRWSMINAQLNLGMPEPVETYHTSDHLYTDLNISRDVTGRLPKAQRTRQGLDAEEIEDMGKTGRRSRRSSRNGRSNCSRRTGRSTSVRRSQSQHSTSTHTTSTGRDGGRDGSGADSAHTTASRGRRRTRTRR